MAIQKLTICFAFAVLLLAAGCPSGPQSGSDGQASSAGKSGAADSRSGGAEGGQNLLDGTPMADRAPNNLALNRAGTTLFASVVPTEADPMHFVTAMDLTSDGLSNPRLLYQMKTLGKTYLSVHPDADRCLIVKSVQAEDGSVVDQVREGETGKAPREFRLHQTPGIPLDGPFDNLLDIQPVYSWDGETIIAPLVGTGMVIKGDDTLKPVYVAYPELDFPFSGKAIQPIETQNGKRRLVLSFWLAGEAEEHCRLYTFDLDSLEYKLIADLKWVVYKVASSDYDNEPWLIAGSRGRQSATEVTRTPLLAWLDPSGSGNFDSVEFLGEPVWQVELDARGEYVVFLDRLRHALVRLHLESGELDSDPDLFTENVHARILLNGDASRVLLWDKTSLLQADWK